MCMCPCIFVYVYMHRHFNHFYYLHHNKQFYSLYICHVILECIHLGAHLK